MTEVTLEYIADPFQVAFIKGNVQPLFFQPGVICFVRHRRRTKSAQFLGRDLFLEFRRVEDDKQHK